LPAATKQPQRISFNVPRTADHQKSRRNSFRELFSQAPPAAAKPRQAAPRRLQFSPPGMAVAASRSIRATMPEHWRAAGGAQGPPSQPAPNLSAGLIASVPRPMEPASPEPVAPRERIPADQHISPPPGIDLNGYTYIPTPVSLEPLYQAMRQNGMNPASFQFDQLEAYMAFPGRPEFDFINRQILIRGPRGAGMFDLRLVLRSPSVTAVELASYGIA